MKADTNCCNQPRAVIKSKLSMFLHHSIRLLQTSRFCCILFPTEADIESTPATKCSATGAAPEETPLIRVHRLIIVRSLGTLRQMSACTSLQLIIIGCRLRDFPPFSPFPIFRPDRSFRSPLVQSFHSPIYSLITLIC